jgi:hypothetical protein
VRGGSLITKVRDLVPDRLRDSTSVHQVFVQRLELFQLGREGSVDSIMARDRGGLCRFDARSRRRRHVSDPRGEVLERDSENGRSAHKPLVERGGNAAGFVPLQNDAKVLDEVASAEAAARLQPGGADRRGLVAPANGAKDREVLIDAM